MGKRIIPVIAPAYMAERVRAMVFVHGVAATSEQLGGLGREAVCCIAGELPTSPAAIALAGQHLPRAPKAA